MCLIKRKIVARLSTLVLLGSGVIVAQQPAPKDGDKAAKGAFVLQEPMQVKQDMQSLAFSPDGKILAVGFSNRCQLWDAKTGKEIRQVGGENDRIAHFGFSPDGSLLATSSFQRKVNRWEVMLWDASTGKPVREIVLLGSPIFAFLPDGKTLVTRDRLYDVETGKVKEREVFDEKHEKKKLKQDSEPFYGTVTRVSNHEGPFVVTPDGKTLIAVNNFDKTTTTTRRPRNPLDKGEGEKAGIEELEFLERTFHATISLVDLNVNREFGSFAAGVKIASLGVSGDGKYLVVHNALALSFTFKARSRKEDFGQESRREDSKESKGDNVGERFKEMENNSNTSLCFWDLKHPKILHQFPDCTSFSMAHDGRTVAAGFGNKVRILEIATGKTLAEATTGQRVHILAVALSPDGRTLLAGCTNGTIFKWQAAK